MLTKYILNMRFEPQISGSSRTNYQWRYLLRIEGMFVFTLYVFGPCIPTGCMRLNHDREVNFVVWSHAPHDRNMGLRSRLDPGIGLLVVVS
jgi:hypothetical protein